MIFFFLSSIIVASPLIVYTGLAYAQSYPRWIVLSVVTALALCLLLFDARKKIQLRFNTIDIVFLLFIFTLALAAVCGVDSTHSIWSSFERSMGVAFWIILFCAHLVLKNIFHTSENHKKLWFIFSATLILMCAWGVAEKYIHGFSVGFSGDRIGGTLGNAIFFGMYLSLSILLLVYVYTQNKTFLGEHSAWLMCMLCTIAFGTLLLTRSRGALLGLLCGILILGIGAVLSAQKTKRTILFGSIGMLGVLIFGIGIFKLSGISLNSATLQTRSIFWSIAWNGFKARPLLGWGPENYRAALDAHFDPRLSRIDLGETYADKPHNALLELFVTSGVVGFVAYGLFIISILHATHTAYRAQKISFHGAFAIIAFLIAHEIQNIFAFETHGSASVLILFTSYISHTYDKIATSYHARSAYGVLCILSIIIGFQNMLHISEARNLSVLWNTTDAKKQNELVGAIADASLTSPFFIEELQSLGEQNTNGENQKIIETAQKLLSAHQDSAETQLIGGKLLMQLFYTTLEPMHADAAEEALRRAQLLSPSRSESSIVLAQLMLKKNNAAGALNSIQAALRIDPELPNARWYRGLILVILKRHTEAAADITFALEHEFTIKPLQLSKKLEQEFIDAGLPAIAETIKNHEILK